jgi:flagellar protein FliO/FliZ
VFEVILRVVVSLGVVLLLFWAVARVSQRRLGLGGARSPLRVLGRQALGRNASVAVVEVGERVLVVGVADSGVRLLTELDPDELPATTRVPAVAAAGTGPGADPATAAADGAVGPVGPVPRPTAGLHGSVLSGQTWKQAWAAATRSSRADGLPRG